MQLLLGPLDHLLLAVALIGPRGDIIAKAPVFEEGIIEADVDLKQLEIARQFRPTLKETREDVLMAVLKAAKMSHDQE